jgi:hypothetical protein
LTVPTAAAFGETAALKGDLPPDRDARPASLPGEGDLTVSRFGRAIFVSGEDRKEKHLWPQFGSLFHSMMRRVISSAADGVSNASCKMDNCHDSKAIPIGAVS